MLMVLTTGGNCDFTSVPEYPILWCNRNAPRAQIPGTFATGSFTPAQRSAYFSLAGVSRRICLGKLTGRDQSRAGKGRLLHRPSQLGPAALLATHLCCVRAQGPPAWCKPAWPMAEACDQAPPTWPGALGDVVAKAAVRISPHLSWLCIASKRKSSSRYSSLCLSLAFPFSFSMCYHIRTAAPDSTVNPSRRRPAFQALAVWRSSCSRLCAHAAACFPGTVASHLQQSNANHALPLRSSAPCGGFQVARSWKCDEVQRSRLSGGGSSEREVANGVDTNTTSVTHTCRSAPNQVALRLKLSSGFFQKNKTLTSLTAKPAKTPVCTSAVKYVDNHNENLYRYENVWCYSAFNSSYWLAEQLKTMLTP